jgi:hypothetical protein
LYCWAKSSAHIVPLVVALPIHVAACHNRVAGTFPVIGSCILTDHQFVGGRLLRFYPHFSTFLTHMTSCALSFPTPPTPCTQHVPPSHRTYPCLRRTYVHYPIHPCPCLVPYGCAVASYYVPLTHSSLTHLSPLVLYTFPIWYTS